MLLSTCHPFLVLDDSLIPTSAQETSTHLAETSCPSTGVGKDRKIYINVVFHT